MEAKTDRYIKRWKWYFTFGGILTFLAILYILLHLAWPGEERVKLSKDDVTHIQTIINELSRDNKKTKAWPAGKPVHNAMDKAALGACYLCKDLDTRNDTILCFINCYIRSKYPIKDTCNFNSVLNQFRQVNFNISFISNYDLKVDSYFWLTENKVFLEIIFWTLFGLLSNLLYHVSEALRSNQYNPNEVYVHWAKMMYSPIISIVIYFSIEGLIADGQVSLNNLRHGLVVLSFILGFFSGRTIDLVNRLKDILLPLGKTSDLTDGKVYDLKGVIRFTGTAAGDLSKALVKIVSMTDSAFTDITNPEANGDFGFEGLKTGDYIIQAEVKAGEEVYEGRATVTVPYPDAIIIITLQRTNPSNVSPAQS